MKPNSSQKDIELPLLSKEQKKSSLNSSPDHLLESQTPVSGAQKYLDVGVVNRMLFSWITTIVHRGNTTTFQQDHHYGLRDEEDTYYISKKFSSGWEELKSKKYALLRTQFKVFKSLVLISQALAALQTLLDFTGPILVAQIITYIAKDDQPLSEALFLIFAFILSRICIIIVTAQCSFTTTLLQNQVIAGTKGLVYHKFLKFPLMRNKEYSSGKIMNLMLVDIENIAKIFFHLPQLVQFPFTILIGIYFIYASIGLAFIGGIISVVIVTVVVSKITKILFGYQHSVMEAKDERMKKTNEVMTGIKYIKMCGIEDKFTESVLQSREKELKWLKLKQIFTSLRILFVYLTPVLLVIAVFGCYILFEGDLTAQKAFVVLATLVVIQRPINWISQILNDVLLGQVSLGRVQDFMCAEEIDTSIINSKKDEADNVAVKINNGNFTWTADGTKNFFKDPSNLILKDINLQIPKGSFVAILGDVGSGKTSLFNCMMGEMLYDQSNPPSIRLNGSVSYVAQRPWIINATVKDNTLFGSHCDKTMYQEALRTSCLQSDLKILIKKDETEIGEKGVNLSGGQKARIALARAIYANSDIYLLDDPLSAVDAHVGKYIIEECLTGQLKQKTRILVTHKIESLRYVDYIYIFKSGRIVAEGSLDEIRKTPYYQEIEQNATKEAKNEEAEELEEKISSKGNSIKEAEDTTLVKRRTTQKQSSRHEGSIHEQEDQKEMLNKLMLDEDRQVGAIGWNAWFTYLKYLGDSKFYTSQTFMLVVWIILKMGADFWLAHWSNVSGDDEHSNTYYYGIYTAMGIFSSLSLFAQTLLMFLEGNKMSQKLHTDMFSRVIRAPLNLFFDRVPLGRLINRFASDLEMVDNTMIMMLTAVSHFPLNLLSRFIVCAVTGTLWVFPLAFVFMIVGIKIQRYYLNVYREAFRLNRITSSPVTSTFVESLDGLPQIRVSKYQQKFLSKYAHRQNENMKNQILVAGLQGWFNFYINASSLLIVGPTVALAILQSRGSSNSSGLIGLLLTYLLDLSNVMIMTLQMLSNFESQLIAFERCKAFTKVEVENEPHTSLPVANYNQSWPEDGQIEFKNYYAKYRPNLPFVIKDLSVKISPAQKVGVVGRTGSGKSTTLLCLLRIIESPKGQILIDGVDISQIGLDDLRRKITIIPQDPLLYKGTVRSNLDLFNQYGDQEVWNALEKVCMRNKFLFTGLDSEIKEGGENLSAGEKQLLCIARAILSKSKIILIDEATSSIDNVTEEVILQSIHENFKDCTMITIAHRLKTIIGSDKVLFMENGRAVEFDSPQTLLNNKNGHFYKLWKEYENAQV